MKNTLYILVVMLSLTSCVDNPKDVTAHSGQNTEKQKEDKLVGSYITANADAGAHCLLKITRMPNGPGYAYRLTTDERIEHGKLTQSHDATTNQDFIMLEGIHWDEYDSDISDDENDEAPKNTPPEEPVGIGGLVTGDTISIQNYGNAMNNYTKLAEVSDKYIILIKQ